MERYATIADLIAFLPTFVDPGSAQTWLDAMAQLIDLDAFKSRSMAAHAFLTLHAMTVAGAISGAETGPVTSRRVRDLATTYASLSMPSDDELATTRWGRLFIAQRRATPTIGVMVS